MILTVISILLGTEVSSIREGHGMPVVDTAYVRSEYRNRGFGTEILSDVIARFPNKDIGFSRPISSSMLKSKFSGFSQRLFLVSNNNTIHGSFVQS